MTASTRQVRALVHLRWRMIRSRRAAWGFGILAALGPALVAAAVAIGRQLPRDQAFNTALLLPTALLGFTVLAIVAPLIAGGGYELYPAEQLTPYPLRPAATFIASVIQAPLNLAWMTQVVLLAGAASFATVSAAALTYAVPLLLMYVAAVTVVGQAVSWLVVAARMSSRGRAAVWLIAGAVSAWSVGTIWTHHVTDILDRSPTVALATAMIAGEPRRFVGVALVLLVMAAAGGWAGACLVGWSQRRPQRGGATRREASTVARRVARVTVYLQLLATDRASVWRSTALRRGALVTALLPGTLAALVGVDWFTIVAIPGLVAAGAGLLFGVNVFSLDAQGTVWLASQPVDPRLQMRAKLRVVAETCVVTASTSLLLSTLNADHSPTFSQALAAVAAVLACSAAVGAICADLSVNRPHRADLRGARDTPAPPGSMVGYSVRLATVTTLLGMTFAGIGMTDDWIASVVLSAAILGLAVVSVRRDLRKYADLGRRARIVSTVAQG